MGIPFVDPIQQLITQDVYGCLKKHFLILIHFKKNFIDLEERKKELEKLRGKVEEQVEKALEQSEVIIKEVLEWMVDMEKTKKEVDVLLQEKTGRESIVCFRLGFPNFISRYRLSKRAEEKTVDVQKKIDGRNFSAVSGPAPPPPELPPTIGEYKVFESRAVVLNKIKDALKENNVVGIHGAGGVGKTTMAAEVIKQLQSEGYIHEFAIAVVSEDPNVKRIQGKLASCLKDFQLDEMENKEERAKKLWKRLKNGKSNLVLLDDLWGKINLREIGIPVLVGNNECKLLITSRQPQEVWKDKSWDSKLHVKVIPIEQLKDKEAWELFKNHAGDSIESSELRLIASQVCKKCGGLPIAIRAVGEVLKDKDLYEWSDALKNLEKSRMERIVGIDEELFPSLKLSYEMLKSEEERKCFLLCCLFPDNAKISIEDLVMHCMAALFVVEDTMEETRCRVHTLIKHLKERSLLLDVADEENSVKVHDMIRDVGLSISKEGNESLQLMHGFRGGGEEEGEPSSSSNSERKIKRKPYIAMWLRKSDFKYYHSFPGDVGTLVLDWYDSSIEDDHTLLLRANKFLCRKILSLKVLVLNGLNISSVFPPSSSGGESLPNLRMLWLDTWKEDDAALLRQLGKLKVFRLGDCYVEELPAEIGLLTELLVLDLKDLRRCKKIPNGILSKLTRLEELHLPIDFTQWGNGENGSGRSENVSISELSCLKRLTALSAFFPNCDLPWANDIFFGKLNRFYINVGDTVHDYIIVYTKGLKLVGVSITNKFNGLICKADWLSFKRVNGLSEAIHGTSHGFPHLKKLDISGCHDLNYVFTEPCARALPQLRHLKVSGCKSLVSIVRGIEEEISEQDQGGDIIYFGRLEGLELINLPNLVGFHSWVKNRTSAPADGATYMHGKIVYPALKGCNFWAIHSFPCLKQLVIKGCPDLNYAFTKPCARALPEHGIVGGIEEEISEQDQGGDIIFFRSLKLNYEMLCQEAQRCFLLCCLFPEDSEIPVEELVLHCLAAGFVGTVKVEETRNRVNTLISILKSHCLLLDVPYRTDIYCVKVHVVIRHIGIAISKKGNESLRLMHGFRGPSSSSEGEPSSSSSSEGKIKRKPYIAMWLRKSDFKYYHSFPGDLGTLVLDWYDSFIEVDHTLLLRANKFLCGKILSLKVLVLNGLNISSVFPPSSSGGESLPNLRMLWLDTWKADDAAVLRHLQKLKVFRLTDRDVVELPAEIGLLTELLVLDLKDLRRCEKIPNGVLSKLTLLEELHLKKLDISGCHDLNYVFTEPCARALRVRHLKVSGCKSLVSIVGGIEEEISEQDQGGDIIYFRRLERLELINLPNLVGFHSWVKNRTSAAADGATYIHGKIVYPALKGCNFWAIHGFPCLKQLVIKGCPDLNYVFTEPCARALPELRILRVVNCESLVSIVGGIEEEISEQDQGGDIIYFGRLEELYLANLPNLVGFHSWVKNRTSAAADGANYIRGKIVYPALNYCRFWVMPKATEVFKSRILPQLTGQDSKEICQQENDFQGVSLPSLTYLDIFDYRQNLKMPEEISFTRAEHGITVRVNEKNKKGVDKTMFQPLLDALLGFGCE